MICPHCGGSVEVIVPADAVQELADLRDKVIDSMAEYFPKIGQLIGMATIVDPAELTPEPEP